ncbi:hypothetical protein LOTGIDRAFT_155173 [Lottia gigantea]|uniref:USP domain-containing protein n=1 Tax=Lottia gigantea TaxID=225164 RepID=V3ZMY9_LOTGI|nr:hypothetical protein LOTGIDRAFT_155173 [Lottia gigantea]ESO85682.1 hypothetical protein LOTGIDRAFT_155173 [Lottia gigantea]
MVVADDVNGPAKKKPRLSLKASKKTTPSTADEASKVASATPLDFTNNSETASSNIGSDTQEVSAESCVPYDGPLVPPVSSLENLGNTCFLNSILQVLRYTPKFLTGLTELYTNIIILEKAAKEKFKQESLKEENESQEEETDLSWELVKHLYKMYKDMDNNEERYSEIASADVTSMAVKPNRILDIIREFNPMFEGNFQHDAQELLRCLLCYLEDAEKALNVKTEEFEPYIVKPIAKANSIMTKFLMAGKTAAPKCEQAKDLKNGLTSLNLDTKLAKGDVLEVHNSSTQKKNQSKRKASKRLSESDLTNEKDSRNSTELSGRRRLSAGSVDETRSQPSVATMFNKSEVPRRRLGMRGAVVSPPASSTSSQFASTDLNNNVDFMHDVNNNENSVPSRNPLRSKSPAELASSLGKLSCDSPSKDTDLKEAQVRLQKCDRVCDSPLKTVSANEAIKNLSFNKRKRDMDSPINKFTNQAVNRTKVTAEINESPAKRKVTFDQDTSSSFQLRHTYSPIATSPKTLYLNNSLSPTAAFKDKMCSPSPLRRSPRKSESPLKPNIVTTPTKMCTTVTKMSPCNLISSATSSAIVSPRRQSPRLNRNHLESPTANSSNSPKAMFKSPLGSISPSPAKRKVNFDLPHAEGISSPNACRKSPRNVYILPSPKKSESTSSRSSSAEIKKEPVIRYDFVERLFQGTMMLRTKCIECEFSRERKEDFQDVSVPLRREKEEVESDEEVEGEVDDSCLSKLMSAFSEVERLKEDNKYFCENCFRYVEAERSLHYEVLPDVLTLHLKRFSASDRLYGSLTKINDHITLPVTLPCLQYQCPRFCNKPSHRYSLYGIVTHAGTTITSGHYLSYVKIDSNSKNEIKVEPEGPNAHLANLSTTPFSTEWYECDDEAIRICSDEDFRQKLIGKESSLMGTPYVLFYHRQNLLS